MPAVQVVHPPGFPAERAYAARVVLGEWLGLEYSLAEGAVEAWELHCNGAVASLPDRVFGTSEENWLTVDAADDVLGTVFLLVTRYEETVLPERDEHDRFPVTATRQDLDRPEADQLVLSLRRQLAKVAPGLETRWHPFRVVPSHDVDYPFASPRLRLSALRQGQLRAALPRDPFDTFDRLMDESERRGLRATFFFLADGSIYSLDDPKIRKLLKRIHVRGHELGLHGGYETFRDPARLKTELERLVAVCGEEGIRQHNWGGRQHFLRWENPTTWLAYEEAGLAYDATLGYSARPGFRAGTCREYPVFDLSSRRELRLRERPLVLMDTPTLDRIDDPEAAIRRLRDESEAVRGDFTVLWHNNWLVTARQRRLLQAALGETT
jgi:peptidoglycan/xylan/chitin deacetylase (PgdA/CDA1 family)